MQYCLHCGEKLGTLVKWHAKQTCAQFLQQAANSKAAVERKMLEDTANAGYACRYLRICERLCSVRYPKMLVIVAASRIEALCAMGGAKLLTGNKSPI